MTAVRTWAGTLRSGVLGLCLLLAGAVALRAQGVTTSAVTGTVTGEGGQPLAGMQVIVRQTQTGAQTGTLTRADGRYYVQGLLPGGPYTIRVEGLGYASSQRTGISLVLSQTARFDFQLTQQAVELGAVTVTAERNGTFATTHTGPATTISDSVVMRMPTLTRNFTDFVRIAPNVTAGASGSSPSVGGQNNRFNNIQIDGAATNDLFGLGSSGTPGGQVNAKPVSIEAVEQFQILSAPFDVRQGGFTGGLINAVTRSGTNRLKGSLFFFGRNQNFMGDVPVLNSATGAVKLSPNTTFKNTQYGFTLGGPIIRDKLHFFVNGELEQFNRPYNGPSFGREPFSSVGVVEDSLRRFQSILQSKYGFAAGDYGVAQLNNPKGNAFGRLDWSINGNNRLTIRDSYSRAQDDNNATRNASFYGLTGGFYVIKNYSNSLVAELQSSVRNTMFNELLLNYELVRDRRNPNLNTPEFYVRVGSLGDTSSNGSGKMAVLQRQIFSGGEFSSQANELDQDVLEVTDNFTVSRGIHKFTLGTHNEFFKFRNLFSQGVFGRYNFNSLADFETGKVASYSINVPVNGQSLSDITARFKVYQLGGYLQDQIAFSERLNVSLGLRVDAPLFPDHPRSNAKFAAQFGQNTSDLPSGKPLFSPRAGFNYDVTGTGRTQLRGGAGLFTGRPPYVWLSNSYGNTGQETVSLNCNGNPGTPSAPPTFNPANPSPTTCGGGLTASAGGAPVVNIFDPNFEFPQDAKFSAGIDQRLPFGFTGTLEGLYTKSIHQIFVQEWNIKHDADGNLQSIGTDAHGRPLYGTPATGGIVSSGATTAQASINRVSQDFLQVIRLTNQSQNYAYQISGSLQKRFSNFFEMLAGYTFAHSYDTQSLTSSVATSNYGFNPISGDPNHPPVMPSNWDVPHKITFSGTATPLRAGRFGSTEISLIYVGQSGYPYSYTVTGDANGDGYQATNVSGRNNDLVFVPATQADIQLRDITSGSTVTQTIAAQWAALDQFISKEPCLQAARGKFLPRNSCREPWHNRLDGRIQQTVPTLNGQSLQIILDVFNIPNLLNSSWGRYEIAPNNTVNMINLVGWNTTTRDGIYQFPNPPTSRSFLNPTSQWQIQLGGRYAF